MPVSNVDAQGVYSDQGLRTQYGIILPPGARVAAYVRSTGLQSGDDSFLANNLVATLAQGLARVRPGLGDFVVCLPGHAENVVDNTTFSAALVAGTKIVGVGRGGNTPTFTWTINTAQWVVNKVDVVIAGLRLIFGGVNGVAANISVTAADFGFYYNEVETSNAAFAGAGISFSGGTRADISGNVFRGVTQQAAVTIVLNTGNDVRICDNEFIGPVPSATGHINIVGAVVGLKIFRNYVENTVAASVAAITFASVASDGICADNRFHCKNTGAMVSGTNVIVIGAATLMNFDQNYCTNDPKTSGIILPTADT